MSGPVPSPSMKGRIGLSGTWKRPFRRVTGSPPAGIFGAALAMARPFVSLARATIPDPRGAAAEARPLVACASSEYLPPQNARLAREVVHDARPAAGPAGPLPLCGSRRD